MSEGDVSLACVSLLVDELVRGGMRHACLSPGSRSTPISLALARHEGVRVHVHLDERASAFFGLGIAKATGEPVAVACTSGTAAANFFPAVVEASQSRTRLILLTADRPPEVRGTGANQTIDQVELYGRYVRRFVDAPLPREGDGSRWRGLGAEAIARGRGRPPGPVHVNLPFREPLTPEGAEVTTRVDPGSGAGPAPGVGPPGPTSLHQTSPPVAGADVERLWELVSGVERGTVVIGSVPRHPGNLLLLARKLGWPVVAEPTSSARLPGRALSAGEAVLSDAGWVRDHRPEVVLQAGAAPTSRSTQAFVASAGRGIVVDADHLDPDPERRATWKLRVDADAVAVELASRVAAPPSSPWREAWLRADAATRRTIDDLLDRWDEPFEGRVARDLAAAIPAGSSLVVGSSMPIRDLDRYMAPREGIRVLANRGASGIDGFVSTTLGVAASGVPTYALCGDLTLLHDAGSLLWSARRGLSAVFVVPNNDGGAIFSFLPQRDLPEFEQLFATPHGRDLAKLCEAAGAGQTKVGRAGDLAGAVETAAGAGGVWIIEVPSDRERNLARHAEVESAVAVALAALR